MVSWKNLVFFRAVQEWHNWLHSARTQRSDNSQTHLKTPGIHKYHSDTRRQPHSHPTDISIQHKTPADSNRHQWTATETNRRQQTPADTARCFLMSLTVSAGVCWCLLASVGVLCCLEMSGGYLWEFLRVSEWYLGKFEVLGCVWGLSECPVLSEKSKLHYFGRAMKYKICSPDYTETSKYQNVQISAFQKSLGYAIY